LEGSEDHGLEENCKTSLRSRFPKPYVACSGWVKEFAKHAKHLILLMKKAVDSVWGLDQKTSMEDFEASNHHRSLPSAIDYHSD